ncbi:MAG: tetratricopeptide repeat protein [Thermoguttaceae bacterium]|jgi:tetratricopeptide (TPR) repeat protein
MAAKWFYQANGQEVGPVASGELRRLADTGTITPHTLVCAETAGGTADGRWARAAMVEGMVFQRNDQTSLWDLDEIMREAKAPRKCHPKVLTCAERIVSGLSPAERRKVLVFAMIDRLLEWADTESEAASQRLKARHADFFDAAKRIADYTEAIRLNPGDAEAYHNRGGAYNDMGDYDKAIADLTEAIRLDPRDARVYHDRGWANKANGDPDRAIADFAEAIRLDPKMFNAYSGRGLAYERKGDRDKAAADFAQADVLAHESHSTRRDCPAQPRETQRDMLF